MNKQNKQLNEFYGQNEFPLQINSGYGVNRAVQMCNSPENINPENRDRLIKFISNQMDRLLGYRREYREGRLLRNQ